MDKCEEDLSLRNTELKQPDFILLNGSTEVWSFIVYVVLKLLTDCKFHILFIFIIYVHLVFDCIAV